MTLVDRQRILTVLERFLYHHPEIQSLPLSEKISKLVEFFPAMVVNVRDYTSEEYSKIKYLPLYCGNEQGGWVAEVYSLT
jgi:hypothetical protein